MSNWDNIQSNRNKVDKLKQIVFWLQEFLTDVLKFCQKVH